MFSLSPVVAVVDFVGQQIPSNGACVLRRTRLQSRQGRHNSTQQTEHFCKGSLFSEFSTLTYGALLSEFSLSLLSLLSLLSPLPPLSAEVLWSSCVCEMFCEEEVSLASFIFHHRTRMRRKRQWTTMDDKKRQKTKNRELVWEGFLRPSIDAAEVMLGSKSKKSSTPSRSHATRPLESSDFCRLALCDAALHAAQGFGPGFMLTIEREKRWGPASSCLIEQSSVTVSVCSATQALKQPSAQAGKQRTACKRTLCQKKNSFL